MSYKSSRNNKPWGTAQKLMVVSLIALNALDQATKGMEISGAFQIISDIIVSVLVVSFFMVAVSNILGPIDFSWPFSGRSRKKKETYGRFPHFENDMKIERVTEIIESSHFSPYTTASGEKLDSITVSEDEKWLCILDGYLPLDFICGYNAKKNALLAIDGAEIHLPKKARLQSIRSDIDAFFRDRGIYYTSLPKKADDSYFDLRNIGGLKIDREDFCGIRYMWEKAIANEKNDFWVTDDHEQPVRPDVKSDLVSEAHEWVLSDENIQKVIEGIRVGRDRLLNYLAFDAYRNEFSVCNGVEILEKLGYPENEQGVDFLFRCISDVDEAYFKPAVEALKRYPAELIQAKIEEKVKLAYESYDAVNLAGIMYLAKEIGYKIEFIENLKGNKEGFVPEFDFDEVAAFGSEEVQEFNGGVAYKKA